ncbi:esterase/lipase family protein [Kitasatospora sp. NPDC001095]
MTRQLPRGSRSASDELWAAVPPVGRDTSQDAVIVVPGIMGSTLQDTVTGARIWGLGVKSMADTWLRPDGMLPLHLTPDEQDGRFGRVRATGLLERVGWAPFLRGFEPYTDLVRGVGEVVAHPKAVLAFAYDWRLPVGVNAALLAEAARRHLSAWRAHPAHDRIRRLRADERPAQLVFVAHSMGGLVTRAALTHTPDLEPDTRAVITLGTPFHGAVKAAVILNGHRGEGGRAARGPGALLRRRMQALASTLPGVHDLLPGFRCVDDGREVRRLTPSDIEALGGDRELAARSQEFQQWMRLNGRSLPGHRAVVGVAQPTVQSMRLKEGMVHAQYVTFRTHSDGRLVRDAVGVPQRVDLAGDGTVYRDSGSLGGPAVTHLPLQHGPMSRDSDVIRHVRNVITSPDEPLGPPMGDRQIGLDVPDAVEAGAGWNVRLTGTDTHAGVTCSVHDAETDRRIATPRFGWQDDTVGARVTLPAPGLYRLRIESGGNAPVTQLVLAVEPDDS